MAVECCAARARRASTRWPVRGLELLNFNVEAQCTPSRSALLTGRYAIRSGTQTVDVTGGTDGMTRWEVTIAQALSDAGCAIGMWGKWHLGSDPEQRSPVDFGFDEGAEAFDVDYAHHRPGGQSRRDPTHGRLPA